MNFAGGELLPLTFEFFGTYVAFKAHFDVGTGLGRGSWL
jgi:hypothetical protein